MFKPRIVFSSWTMICLAVLSLHGGPAYAAPAGYQNLTASSVAGGVAAIAYAPDGTLYVADMADRSRLVVVAPGGARSTLPLSGPAITANIGGLAVDPLTGNLLLTDSKNFGDGQGALYLIDKTSGAVNILLSGMEAIDDVAVRSTGEIFVTNAAGGGAGGVYLVSRLLGNPANNKLPVVGGLDYAAGLAFDPAGNLLYQQANASFAGEVYRLPIGLVSGMLSLGSPQTLATGLAAGFDLAADADGDVFVSGGGGVFQLNRDGGGNFTGSAAPFDGLGFTTELAFRPGPGPFEPFSVGGGTLSYVPGYGSADLASVTPVPEPATLGLLAAGAVVGACWTRFRKARNR